jgi:hypothetical protein
MTVESKRTALAKCPACGEEAETVDSHWRPGSRPWGGSPPCGFCGSALVRLPDGAEATSIYIRGVAPSSGGKRMRVECEVEEAELEGDYGPVDGLCVRCGRCDHEVEVFGTSGRSVRRALVMLREECPNGEENYYTADGSDED